MSDWISRADGKYMQNMLLQNFDSILSFFSIKIRQTHEKVLNVKIQCKHLVWRNATIKL